MRKFGVAVALLLGMTVCTASRAGAQTSRFNVFGGYSYGTNNFYTGGDPAMHGYGASFAVNVNNHIGFEGSFTGHNGTPTLYNRPATSTNYGYFDRAKEGLYDYTFGPRLFQNVGNFSLFTHFLVGAVHFSATETDTCTPPTSGGSCGGVNPYISTEKGTGFAFKTGGGADWNHGHWGIRILEVDYVRGEMLAAFSDNAGNSYSATNSANNFELTTGITFNFGSSL